MITSGTSIVLQRPRFVIVRLPILHRLSAHRRTAPPLAPATAASGGSLGEIHNMQFAGWYLKIAAVGASIGAAMELFMIHTGFYEKVTVLESEKRAWESSREAQAMREALNPWHKHDEQQQEK